MNVKIKNRNRVEIEEKQKISRLQEFLAKHAHLASFLHKIFRSEW
mgnify:CR=1 FL=1